MLRLPTVLLLHETITGSHYDWLLADPRDVSGPLWTTRVAHHSQQWSQIASWDMQPIPAHRRIYLNYEGPLSNNRGQVRRVDQGFFQPRLWTQSRIVLSVDMRHVQGDITLQRISENLWRAMMHP